MLSFVMIFKHVALQFFWLFGPFLLGGAILTYLSRWTNNTFLQFAFPKVGLYLFGAIGIAVHELSHAFFCKLFWHDIQSVKLFDPSGKGGAQGSVTHSYQPWNPYQRLGHFFIGLGPSLIAPVLLALLFYAFTPSAHALSLVQAKTDPMAFTHHVFVTIFSRITMRSIGFWIFAYLALCISSQIELSGADWKQVQVGTIPIVILLFVMNLGFWAFHFSWHLQLIEFAKTTATLAASFYVFAAALTLLNLIFCTGLFSLLHILGGKAAINPFGN